MGEIVRMGYTAEMACDKIYQSHGASESVIKIINA